MNFALPSPISLTLYLLLLKFFLAAISPCSIRNANSTYIECAPVDDENFEAGSIYATVKVLDTVVSNTAAVATVLPMIEVPVGGNVSIGRPPTNVPSVPVVTPNVTLYGRYLTRIPSTISVNMGLGPVQGTCSSILASTARTMTCAVAGGQFSTLGPLVAQINVTVGGVFVLPGVPNLAAFVIPRVNPPTSILNVSSTLNTTSGTLSFTGLGFGPNKENNTVLLYGLVKAYNGDPAYPCTVLNASSTAISCELPAYMIAGTYGASVIVGASLAGPAPPALLTVTPVVTSANASSCCIDTKYTAVVIEGAGFSINETEQFVSINDPRYPNVTSCRTSTPTFPGLASIGNGKMTCLLDLDVNDLDWLENVTVTVRGQQSAVFRIKGLKKDVGDKQILAISIVGPLIAVVLVFLVAVFVWNSSFIRDFRNRNKAEATYQPLEYRTGDAGAASPARKEKVKEREEPENIPVRGRSKSKGKKRETRESIDEAPSSFAPPSMPDVPPPSSKRQGGKRQPAPEPEPEPEPVYTPPVVEEELPEPPSRRPPTLPVYEEYPKDDPVVYELEPPQIPVQHMLPSPTENLSGRPSDPVSPRPPLVPSTSAPRIAPPVAPPPKPAGLTSSPSGRQLNNPGLVRELSVGRQLPQPPLAKRPPPPHNRSSGNLTSAALGAPPPPTPKKPPQGN